jgi:hypothetical protein
LLKSVYYVSDILYGVASFKLLFIGLLFLIFLVCKGVGLLKTAAGKAAGGNSRER